MTIASACSVISFSLSSQASFAQNAIAPDATLPINTLVNFNNVNKTYTITGGTQVGVNQFHSFQDFSVPTGNTAHFDTLPTTINAISRVTGANISNIDGLIKANGTTNLYLINPNGIVFGKDAKLEIGGTFGASTANSFNFPDGSEFSATSPQAPPLLNVNVPLGLQYGKSNAGATISNQGNLAAGQDLVLNADKLDLQGSLRSGLDLTLQAQDSVKILDTATSPFVVNSGRDLTIQGNNSVDIFVFNNPLTQIVSGRHLSLVSDGVISGDAHFLSGGNLSFLTTTGEVANFVSNYASLIYANGDVRFGDYTGAALKVEATGSIQSGGIRITSPDTSGTIPTSDPDFVTLTTLPSVILRAGVASVNSKIGGTTFSSTTFGDSVGSITFGYIDTSSSTGDGGAIELTAKGDIKANFGYLSSSSNPDNGNSGNGGAISLSSINGGISLPNSTFFSTSTPFSNAESGNGGAISLSTINGDISLPDSLLSSNSISFSDTGNSGNGGAISLSTINGDISLPNSILTAGSSTTFNSYSGNSGNGGAISLSTNTGDILLLNSSLFSTSVSYSYSGSSGNGGAISLSTNTGNISLPNSLLYSYSILNSPSILKADTGNSGNGGAISLSTNTGDISLPNSSLFSTSVSVSFLTSDTGNSGNGGGNSGNGGAISLSTITGNISLKSLELNADSSNSGNGGENPSIDIPEEITLNASELNSYSYSSSGNSGNGGDITLSAIKGNILGAGSPTTSIYSFSIANTPNSTSGAGGNVTLDAKNLINNFELVTASSAGIAGNAKINGFGDLTISGLQVSTSKTVSIKNIRDSSEPIIFDLGTSGSSGDVTVIGLGSLTFDNTIINSATQGSNPAGNISITSPSLINFQNNSQIQSNTNSTGSAGNIFFTAPILDITGGTQVLAETNGNGAGGNIEINASNAVNLTRILNSSPVLSVQTSNGGKAGNILINTPTLTLSDQARISATATKESTNKEGGGSITLNASTMNLSGTVGVFAETESSANAGTLNLSPYGADSDLKINLTSGSKISASTSSSGNGGNIELSAPESISLNGSGEISVTTSNTGNAGNISFNAPSILLTNGVLVSASTLGTGKGGDIKLGINDTTKNTVNNVTLSNGARIDTSTSSSGDSGKIEIIAGNSLILDGNNTGLFAKTEDTSTGNGGSIFIDPPLVSITNGAGISVDSLGQGNGGDLTIFAGKLIFANNAFLRANTASGEGGNINLQIADIFFPRHNSSINATAGGTGNGGNINLSAMFAIAIPSENNDIFANASFGMGGNINLTTRGLFGLEFRPRLTPLSDITASSDFGVNGTVSINTPGVDPGKGLTNLPANIRDASTLVTQRCLADRQGSAFVITGRGGIPASPADVISGNSLQENLGNPSNQLGNQFTRELPNPPTNGDRPDRIVEAKGWTIKPNGQVSLVAEVNNAIPTPTWARQLQCR